MKRHVFPVGVLIVATLLGSFPAVAELTIGVFPRRPAAVTIQSFKPLADHLGQILGENIRLEVSKSFPEFWKNVEKNKYDIVHYNQYHYIKGHAELNHNAIVTNVEQGIDNISGMLTVRHDSGIDTVEDLRGKKVLFGGGKMAMSSYISATAILKQHGLIEGVDYIAAFAKNPPSAIVGVYHKAADAAGSGDIILRIKSVTSKIDVSQIKILATSDTYTHLVWAVKGDMPSEKKEKILSAMTSLKDSEEGKAILNAAKVTGFKKINDGAFAKVREIVEYAIGEKY